MNHQRVRKLDLADAAHVTPSAISKFLTGQSTIAVEKLVGIASLVGVNPKYLTGEEKNPFKSTRLIKILLDEGLLSGPNFDMLFFLADANERLEVVFLLSQSFLLRRMAKDTVFEDLVAAIACKDGDGTMFLFRRKSGNAFASERGLELKLQERARTGPNHHFRTEETAG